MKDKGLLAACCLWCMAILPGLAQYSVTVSDEAVLVEELNEGIYAIRATTAGVSGYIYNGSFSGGENFRVSNTSHPDWLESPTSACQYFWVLTNKSADGSFMLRNLASGNLLPADNTRNANCAQGTAVAAMLQTDERGVLWQTNYDYKGDTLFLHTNYRSEDRCLSYWNELGKPGEGTALQVEFYPCEVEEVIDVRVGTGTFYRQNRYSESTETDNSVYKFVSNSTLPQLTIAAEGSVNNIEVPEFDWYSGKNLSQTYTLSLTEGYRITGYDIIFRNTDTAVPMTFTPAEGGEAVTAEGDGEAFLSVADLHAQTTSFTISADAHKGAHIESFLVYYEQSHIATFELYDGDDVVAHTGVSAFEGDKLTLPEAFVNIPYVKLVWDSSTLMRGEDMTVRVDYIWNGPFELKTETAEPRYFMCLGDSVDGSGNVNFWNPLCYIDAESYDGERFNLGACSGVGAETGTGTPQNLRSASGLWSFEGTPWSGFVIRNADGRLLASAPVEVGSNSGKGTLVKLMDEADVVAEGLQMRWDVAPADGLGYTDGFFLRQHGTGYSLNERQDGSQFFLAFWTSGESAGSVFRVSRTLPVNAGLRVSGIGYTTSYYPFATRLSAGADMKPYTVQLSADGKSLDLHGLAEDLIPAYEPVVLMGGNYLDYELMVAEHDAPRVEDNLLVGAIDSIPVAEEERGDYLVLAWMIRTGFFVSKSVNVIPAHTAYIDNTEMKNTKGLPFGAVTALSDVRVWPDDSVIYDLQGRRVSRPARGVYIIGGKKVYVR